MPYVEEAKARKCPNCGKQKRGWYHNPSTGKGDKFCADCSRAKVQARREARAKEARAAVAGR